MRLCKVVVRKCRDKEEAALRCAAAAMTTSHSKHPSLHAAADAAAREFQDAIIVEKTMRDMAEERCRFAAALKALQTGTAQPVLLCKYIVHHFLCRRNFGNRNEHTFVGGLDGADV